jgi:uncharacterized protein (DUF433 family)
MGHVIAAFSEEQSARLTGVTLSQLRYWSRTGFFCPELDSDVAIGRIYSFQNIVALRVLNVLRNQYGVSLPHLREVSERLAHLAEDRWTGVKLWVLNKKVVWQEPGSDQPQEVVSRQYVVPTIELEVVVADTVRDIRALNQRNDSKFGQVEKSRLVNHNQAVIAGTRIRVSAIKRFHEAGYSVEQIISEYPDLTDADVRAALDYGEVRAAA